MRTWSKSATGAFTALVCLGLASAQSDYSTPSNPLASTPSNGGASAPRTGIYESVTKLNAAADNTVDDYTKRPTLINGKQFFAGWGDADLVSGAFAFQASGYDWFGSALGGPEPDEVRAGLARGGAWGGGVLVSLAKSSFETPAGDSKVVLEGDGLGVFGNLSLGGSDVYGQLALYTGYDALLPVSDNYVKVGGVEQKNTLINLLGGWKKDATSEGTHALNLEGTLNYSMKKNEAPPLDTVTVTALDLWFYHGYILKASESYSVFLGSNSELMLQLEDWNVAPTSRNHYRLAVLPNLAFQKRLAWGFEGFAGAVVGLSWDMWDGIAPTTPIGAPPVGADARTDYLTGSADVSLGLRWVKDNFAVEGSLRDALLANGPHFIGGNAAPGMFAQVGVSLGI